jgi:hypothetical protein
MAPKTTVLPVGRRRINSHKTWFPATDSNRRFNIQSVASCHWTNGEQLNLAGQEGVEPSSFSLTARHIAFMLPTVKKPPTCGLEALLQNVLKKVRLHADTLTRFDRDGYGKIARCSQMLHIEIGYSQITSYLSITKMAVPERIELSRSARQADIMATRSWDPTGASGGDRTHWLRRAPVLRTGATPSRRRLQNGGRDRSRTCLCQDL